MTSLLFVYGTLRHPPLLEALVGHPVRPRPATLAAHRAAPLAGVAYPGLVADVAASAVGAVVDVDAADLDVLDRFEGPAYERVAVDVVVEGAPATADVYRLLDHDGVLAGSWSFEAFLAGDADRWVAAADPGTHHPG